MGKINTAANVSSAFSNAASARSSAATSASVGKLASSDRHRELRQRGLISHRSTPADIAAVEAKLAAEMRGRMLLQGSRPWQRHPYTAVGASVALVLVLSLPILGSDAPWIGGLLMACAIGAGVVFAQRVQAREKERAELIASADWDDEGSCLWCGSTEPHLVEGEEEHPRVAHAYELEEQLGEPTWVEVPA